MLCSRKRFFRMASFFDKIGWGGCNIIRVVEKLWMFKEFYPDFRKGD